jgi:hypothetical protein
LFARSGIKIGPIPRGTPIGLIANLNLISESPSARERGQHDLDLANLLGTLVDDLRRLGPNATDGRAREVFAPLVPRLLALSKCPDLIVNRGHKFGTTLPDGDKQDLIEFLKTF